MLKEEFEELIKREVNENQYIKTHKNIYEFRSDEMVRIYFPELEEKISMATEPEETRTFYGWFGCLSPETKEVRLNIVKDIIKELE